MSKIFLSYKKDVDSSRARIVRSQLAALGVDTFQDVDLSAGTDFPGILDDELRAATAVLVLWSKSSVPSRWVRSEALHGLDSGKLVAASFDSLVPRDLAVPFNSVHTADLSDWITADGRPKADHAGWKNVLEALGKLCGRPLPEIATILETDDAKAKADFVRIYPNDPFAAGLAEELKAPKLRELEHQFARAINTAEKRFADERKRLEQLRPEFTKILDTALRSGALDTLDTRQVIEGSSPDAEQGGGNRRKVSALEVSRLRSELELLRKTRAAAEEEGEKAGMVATQQAEQLKTVQQELDQLRASSEVATYPVWHKDARAWFVVVAVALLAGLIGLFGSSSGTAEAEKNIADQLKVAEQALAQSKRDTDDATAKLADLGKQNDMLSKDSKSQKDLLLQTKLALAEATKTSGDLSKQNGALAQARTSIDGLNTQLKDLSGQNDALSKENKRLADQAKKDSETSQAKLTDLSGQNDALSKENKRLEDQAKKDSETSQIKLTELSGQNEALSKENKRLADQARKASETSQTKLTEFGGQNEALLKENKRLVDQAKKDSETSQAKLADLSSQIDALSKDKQLFAAKVSDLTAANARLASLPPQPAGGSALQSAESARKAREAKCNELAYSSDMDWPAGATRPVSSQPAATVDDCFDALTSLPKPTARRLLVQLSRGYFLQGDSSRGSDQSAATNAYSTAVSMASLASRFGSAQADVMLGYVLGGSLNRGKYTFPSSPNYAQAWSRYEAAANAKHPYGLVYAGAYLLWPACSQNVAPSDPARGLQLIREAQAKNIAEAFYVEGYYTYGQKGLSAARSFFEQANRLGYVEANTFLRSPKTEPCPKILFY